MCSVGAALFAGAMIVTAAAGVYSADSSKKLGQYENEVAQQNANLEDYRAEQVGRAGAMAEEQHRQKVRQMVGTQRASLAANGIDLGSGTAEDMIGDTWSMGEADALTIRYNAMQEAWGLRTNATNLRSGGKAAVIRGKNEATGTYLSTAGSLMSMGASGYSQGMFSKAAQPAGGTFGTLKGGTYDGLTATPYARSGGTFGTLGRY